MNFEKITSSGLVRFRPKIWREYPAGRWLLQDDAWRIESVSRSDGIRLCNIKDGVRIRLLEDNVYHYSSDPNSGSLEKSGFLSLHVKILITASNEVTIEPLSSSEKSQGVSFSPVLQMENVDQLIREASRSQNELQRLRDQLRPREIDSDKFIGALHGHPVSRVEIMFVRDDADSFHLSLQIRDLLRKAGWEAAEPIPVPEIDSQLPSAMAVGGQPTGVCIVPKQITVLESNSTSLRTTTEDWIRTPFTILTRAFMAGLGRVSGCPARGIALPEGTTRIVVAPKAL